jgi:hypothetical protein
MNTPLAGTVGFVVPFVEPITKQEVIEGHDTEITQAREGPGTVSSSQEFPFQVIIRD